MCPGATGRPSHSFFSFLLPFSLAVQCSCPPRAACPHSATRPGPQMRLRLLRTVFSFFPRPSLPTPWALFRRPPWHASPKLHLASTSLPRTNRTSPKDPLFPLPRAFCLLSAAPCSRAGPLLADARPLILAPPVAEPLSWMLYSHARGAPHPSSSLPAPCPPPRNLPHLIMASPSPALPAVAAGAHSPT